MRECWKRVVGYEGRYWVSNLGRVQSKRKLLNPFSIKGYPVVTLSKGTTRKKAYVHLLVAEAFLGSRPVNTHTDHIDRDVTNNHLSNLRYISIAENIRNAKTKEGTTSKYKGVCKRRDRWGAFIAKDKIQTFLGHFDSELEAARAYDKACVDSRTTNFSTNPLYAEDN